MQFLVIEYKEFTIKESHDMTVNLMKVRLISQSSQHLISNFIKSSPPHVLAVAKNSFHIFKLSRKSFSCPVLRKILKNLLHKAKHLRRMITGNTMELHLGRPISTSSTPSVSNIRFPQRTIRMAPMKTNITTNPTTCI